MVVGLLAAVYAYSGYANASEEVDIRTIKQIETDWNAIPFVEIKVDSVPCSDDWEDLFSKEWKGIEVYCMTENDEIMTPL